MYYDSPEVLIDYGLPLLDMLLLRTPVLSVFLKTMLDGTLHLQEDDKAF